MGCDKNTYEIARCQHMPRDAPSMSPNERNECDNCRFYYTAPPPK